MICGDFPTIQKFVDYARAFFDLRCEEQMAILKHAQLAIGNQSRHNARIDQGYKRVVVAREYQGRMHQEREERQARPPRQR